MLNAKAIIAGLVAAAIAAAVVFTLRETKVEPTPEIAAPTAIVAAPFTGPRTKADAMKALMELPELKAWSTHLTQSSGGASNGALIEYGPTPKTIGGKKFWQISYVENTPDAAHRWESFLVGENTPEILVEDDDLDRTLTLDEWRESKNPIARKSAQ